MDGAGALSLLFWTYTVICLLVGGVAGALFVLAAI